MCLYTFDAMNLKNEKNNETDQGHVKLIHLKANENVKNISKHIEMVQITCKESESIP